jgi:PASTA domain
VTGTAYNPSVVRVFTLTLGIVTALGLSAFVVAAQAAPPANDNFAAAVVLAGDSGITTGTNVDATREPGEPQHTSLAGGRSVWYAWTPASTGPARIETCGPGNFDTILAVYTGELVNALTLMGADDDSCSGDKSAVTFAAQAGTTYRIAVDGVGSTAGNFTLTWARVTAPSNDNFSDAIAISGKRGSVRGTTTGASREAGEPVAGGAAPGPSVWYTWTPSFTGAVTFHTCATTYDTVLGAYTGDTLTQLTVRAQNDDSCEAQALIRFPVRAGTRYRIVVAGFGQAQGPFLLQWSGDAKPSNDDFARARRVSGARGSVRGTNVGASAEPGERSHAGRPAAASMWYRWRSPSTRMVSLETCGASFDTIVAVYRGTSMRRLRVVGQNDDSCRLASRVVFRAVRGVTYRIAVDGYGGRVGTFRLRWGRASAAALACRVPDVRGIPLPRARESLRQAGCRLGRITYVRSTRVPSGFVVAQRPRPRTLMRPPRRVQLDVSRGRI